jgi:hypothetical protein
MGCILVFVGGSGSGRSASEKTPLTIRKVRLTAEQWRAFRALGGAKWLREQLNRWLSENGATENKYS